MANEEHDRLMLAQARKNNKLLEDLGRTFGAIEEHLAAIAHAAVNRPLVVRQENDESGKVEDSLIHPEAALDAMAADLEEDEPMTVDRAIQVAQEVKGRDGGK